MSDHGAGGTPRPGIFPGITRQAYDAIPAINFSTLKHCRRSPAHARHRQLNPTEPTDAQELGTLIHCALLEPERFAREYMVMPDFAADLADRYQKPRATKEYRNRVAAFQLKYHDRRFLTADQAETCRRIGEAIAAHPTAADLLATTPALTEAAVVWVDPETGLACKALVDHLRGVLVTDLKTTDDASPGAFSRTVAQHGYHVQAAFYLWGLSVVGRPAERFIHVACETEAPYGVAVYELDTKALDQGLREFRVYLDCWARCARDGHWSAYPDAVIDLALPRYAIDDTGL